MLDFNLWEDTRVTSSFPMSSLSLATIPADIIRKLIRLNPPEDWEKLKLISPMWNALVVKAMNARPSVKRIFMSNGDKTTVMIQLDIANTDVDYFSQILVDVPGLELEQRPNQCVLKFQMAWSDADSLMFLLTRIFASARKVETFQCVAFNGNTLHTVGEAMRNARIERMEVELNLWDESMRNATLKIIKRSKVFDIQIKAAKLVKEDICEALHSFSQFVSIIGVDEWNSKQDNTFGNNGIPFWNLFARHLIDKNDLKMISLRSWGRYVVDSYHCDPFFEFMYKFAAYF